MGDCESYNEKNEIESKVCQAVTINVVYSLFTDGDTRSVDVDAHVEDGFVVINSTPMKDDTQIYTFELSGVDANSFMIDSGSGMLTIVQSPYDTSSIEYNVVITATDESGISSDQEVKLNVIPFVLSASEIWIWYNIPVTDLIHRVVLSKDTYVFPEIKNIDPSLSTIVQNNYEVDLYLNDTYTIGAQLTIPMNVVARNIVDRNHFIVMLARLGVGSTILKNMKLFTWAHYHYNNNHTKCVIVDDKRSMCMSLNIERIANGLKDSRNETGIYIEDDRVTRYWYKASRYLVNRSLEDITHKSFIESDEFKRRKFANTKIHHFMKPLHMNNFKDSLYDIRKVEPIFKSEDNNPYSWRATSYLSSRICSILANAQKSFFFCVNRSLWIFIMVYFFGSHDFHMHRWW